VPICSHVKFPATEPPNALATERRLQRRRGWSRFARYLYCVHGCHLQEGLPVGCNKLNEDKPVLATSAIQLTPHELPGRAASLAHIGISTVWSHRDNECSVEVTEEAVRMLGQGSSETEQRISATIRELLSLVSDARTISAGLEPERTRGEGHPGWPSL
jgi:hypothetical protein